MPRTRTASTTTPGKAGGVRSTPVSATPGRQGASSQTDPPSGGAQGFGNPDHRPKPAGPPRAPVLEWLGLDDAATPGPDRAPPGRSNPRYSVVLTVLNEDFQVPPPPLWTPEVTPFVLKALFEHKGTTALPVGTIEVLEPGQIALLLGGNGGGVTREAAEEVADALTIDEWQWVDAAYQFKGDAVLHQDVRSRVRAFRRKRQRTDRRRRRAGTDLPRLEPDLSDPEPLDPGDDWDVRRRPSPTGSHRSSRSSRSSKSSKSSRSSKSSWRGSPPPRTRATLPTFGDGTGDLSDAYHGWRAAVEMYLGAGYRTADLLPAILGSLRGIPLKLVTALQRPGYKMDLVALLATLKQHFGEVSSYDQLAQKLYFMEQGTNEDAAAFGPRVQSLVHEMGSLYPEQFPQATLADVLRDRFYGGLRPSTRNALHFMMDSDRPVEATYQSLLEAARKVEMREHRESPVTAKPKPANTGSNPGTNPMPFRPAKTWFTRRVTTAKMAETQAQDPEMVAPAPDPEDNPPTPEPAPSEDGGVREADGPHSLQSVAEALDSVCMALRPESRCYNCDEKGHFARECPKPRKVPKPANPAGNGKASAGKTAPAQPTKTVSKP